jgi:hypothetical protein
MRWSFAFHPAIRVSPIGGGEATPSAFDVEYRLRTLVTTGEGPLAYVDSSTVRVELPPAFPNAPPILRPISRLFHPNASAEQVFIHGTWDPINGSLAEWVTRCGQAIAYQTYDPAQVVNPTAAAWAAAYPNLIPTDPHAILNPEAGGDPQSRIARAAPIVLEQYRAQLTEMCLRIREGETSSTEVRTLGAQIHALITVISEADVPAYQRKLASELDEWTQSLTTAEPSFWDGVRRFVTGARAVTTGAVELDSCRAPLEAAVHAADEPIQGVPSDEPLETIGRLPSITTLDPLALRLRAATCDCEEQLAAVRVSLDVIERDPLAPIGTPGGLLHERTTADAARVNAEAAAAREAASAAVRATEPVIARAKAEQAALDALVGWAGFSDLVRRGNQLAQRVIELGAPGIQAFFLHGLGGTFGPHQHEERLELGSVLLTVRRHSPGNVEAYDARTIALLSKGPGPLRIKVTDPSGTSGVMQIDLTEHTGELRLQFEYLINTARQHLAALDKPVDHASKSWAAQFAAALAKPHAIQSAKGIHDEAAARWSALLHDLELLAPLKERWATAYLAERYAEFVPAVVALREKAQASLAEATQKLAFIAGRSTRDAETGVLIVPPHLAEENLKRVAQREKAENDLKKVRKLLALAAAEFQARLGDPRLIGKAGVPRFKLLEFTPELAASLREMLSDERLASRVTSVKQLLDLRRGAPASEVTR